MNKTVNLTGILTVMMLFCCISMTEAKQKSPIVTRSSRVSVQVVCDVPGTQVYADGRLVCAATPGVVTLSLPQVVTATAKKHQAMAYAYANQSVTLTFVKDGYLQETRVLEPSVTEFGNRIYTIKWPGIVQASMKRAQGGAYDKDQTIVAGEASTRVSRDAAGQSALERTIIRWFFDSDPQGAKIFWRVISSIPEEVKNTNETYLMTTPYEETRAFNILGLTYENSRDVQIEIKVSKKGYEDQVKRFNVRQAIDQQEVSSFFQLVPVE